MGFFSRIGSKISSGLHSAARIGKKTLGTVNRVGNKIAHQAEKVLNVVDRIPLVGQVLAPVSGVVRSGIGLVRDVADAAGKGKELITMGEKLLTDGETAVKSKMEKANTNIQASRTETRSNIANELSRIRG
tara:strand:- start:1 stop:393 length:393 start_codon:yes stop_codon:yes gene_type:complete